MLHNQICKYYFFFAGLALLGFCVNAEPATAFSSFVDFLFIRTLDADLAALSDVTSLFVGLFAILLSLKFVYAFVFLLNYR